MSSARTLRSRLPRIVEGLVLLGAGGIGVSDSARLFAGTYGSDATGPGFYGMAVSVPVCVIALVYLYGAMADGEIPNAAPMDRAAAKAVGLLVALIVYTVALDLIGYVIATALFLVAAQTVIARQSWVSRLAFGAIGAAAFYAIFVWLAGIPIGRGTFWG